MYEQLLSFENMYKAYLLAAKGKRGKPEVANFSTNISQEIWSLIEELQDGTYKIGKYNKFTIYDPKEREIQSLPFRDRVVQHCLCDNIVGPFIDKKLIYDNAACRVGKGTHFALKRFKKFLCEHYKKHGADGYVLKYDIKHYFPSIDHDVLKQRLKCIKDERVRELLYQIIDSYESFEDGKPNKGLPMGNQTSQWFALYYLDPMDRLIKEKLRVKHYVRYMDDGVLVHESKDFLKKALAEMQKIADELKLEFNKKTQIFPLRQGVDFLGFRFYVTDTGKIVKKLRTSSKKRWKARLKRYAWEHKNGKKDIEAITRSMKSFQGHIKHGHTYKLKSSVYSKFVVSTPIVKYQRDIDMYDEENEVYTDFLIYQLTDENKQKEKEK